MVRYPLSIELWLHCESLCEQVPARVLPVPRLEYGNNFHLDPGDKGDWNIMDVR